MKLHQAHELWSRSAELLLLSCVVTQLGAGLWHGNVSSALCVDTPPHSHSPHKDVKQLHIPVFPAAGYTQLLLRIQDQLKGVDCGAASPGARVPCPEGTKAAESDAVPPASHFLCQCCPIWSSGIHSRSVFFWAPYQTIPHFCPLGGSKNVKFPPRCPGTSTIACCPIILRLLFLHLVRLNPASSTNIYSRDWSLASS